MKTQSVKDMNKLEIEKIPNSRKVSVIGNAQIDFILNDLNGNAHINENEPDIVHMINMHVILYLTDGRVVNILSDKGTYNKANYDCFFEQNVKASDGETEIFSENLELSGNKSIVKIYNNVVVNYPTGSFLQADNVDYNFETKYFKVSMFDDKRIKMKVLNE